MVQRTATGSSPRGGASWISSLELHGLRGHLLQGLVLRREDLGILREAHDPERLVDRRRQAAEGEDALAVHDLLEHLDQDRDADRVYDSGLLEVEHERSHA